MFALRNRAPGRAVFAFTLVALVAALAAVSASATSARHSTARANSVTYQDSTGESPAALDIATVTVSNDDSGLLTFDVKFANRTPNADTDFAVIGLDTDRNKSTGSAGWLGSEWLITWEGDSALRQWDGSKWVAPPTMRTLVSSVAPNELVIRVNRSELGNVSSFDFITEAQVWNSPSAEKPTAWDDAPDYGHGAWTYEVKLYVAPTLSATAIKCTPDPPRAGKAMTARTTVSVMRGGASEQLGTATIKGTATVAGKKLAATVLPASANGTVGVRWLVPKTAKGKLMRGTITVTLENVSVTRSFSERVK